MKNDIIVKFLKGGTVRGYTLDVGAKDTFHITTSSGDAREIRLDELKAVFLIKDPSAPKAAARPAAAGVKIRIKFLDGEELTGITYDYNSTKDGFFVFPLDPASDNERILVNRHAAASIVSLGSPCLISAKPGAAAGDPARSKLERKLAERLCDCARQFSGSEREVDEGVCASYCASLRSMISTDMIDYLRHYGRDAWRDFVAAKVNKIRGEMGENAFHSMQKITARLM
jgi:hypothetical protein